MPRPRAASPIRVRSWSSTTERRPHYVEGIAARKNPGTVTTVHVLAWDPDERALASVALPMWLLRLKSGPIEFGTYVSGFDDHGVRLEVADLERYGPGVLFDLTGRRASASSFQHSRRRQGHPASGPTSRCGAGPPELAGRRRLARLLQSP